MDGWHVLLGGLARFVRQVGELFRLLSRLPLLVHRLAQQTPALGVYDDARVVHELLHALQRPLRSRHARARRARSAAERARVGDDVGEGRAGVGDGQRQRPVPLHCLRVLRYNKPPPAAASQRHPAAPIQRSALADLEFFRGMTLGTRASEASEH